MTLLSRSEAVANEKYEKQQIYSFAVRDTDNEMSMISPIIFRIVIGKKMVARKFEIVKETKEKKYSYYKKVDGHLVKIDKVTTTGASMVKAKLRLAETLINLAEIITNREKYKVTCTRDSVERIPHEAISELFLIASKRGYIDVFMQKVVGHDSSADSPKTTSVTDVTKNPANALPTLKNPLDWMDDIKKKASIASSEIIAKSEATPETSILEDLRKTLKKEGEKK